MHFVRHGQAEHNVALAQGRLEKHADSRPGMLDVLPSNEASSSLGRLTVHGEEQAAAIARSLQAEP